MASFRSKVCHLSHRWAKVSDDTNRSEYVWRMYSSGAASTWRQATALWDHQVDVWFVVDRRKRPVGPRESVRRVAFTWPVAGINWCCGRIGTVIPVSVVGSTTAAELPPQNACHTNLQNYHERVITWTAIAGNKCWSHYYLSIQFHSLSRCCLPNLQNHINFREYLTL